jgi:hypothetical protein
MADHVDGATTVLLAALVRAVDLVSHCPSSLGSRPVQ